MSARVTTRLPDQIYQRLLAVAQARALTPSDVIREALERHLGAASDPSADPLRRPEPVLPSTPPPHDCVQSVLARLPGEVREGIMERARVLELSASQVLTAMLIAQLPPSQSAPQSSGAVRPPLLEIGTWEAFKQRRRQGTEAPPAPTNAPSTPGAA
jgi:hypothetical protein